MSAHKSPSLLPVSSITAPASSAPQHLHFPPAGATGPTSAPRTAVPSPSRRAYAKLQLHAGPFHYLTSRSVSIGRGPGADLVISSDRGVSRVHAHISYSAAAATFTLAIAGKNGAFVNGRFCPRGAAPIALASQTEITFGKVTPVTFVFLLPAAGRKKRVDTHQDKRRERLRQLVYRVGEAILASPRRRLSADAIFEHLRATSPSYVASFGSGAQGAAATQGSIRHALTFNHRMFLVHPADDLQTNVHAADIEVYKIAGADRRIPKAYLAPPEPVAAAEFSVVEDEWERSLK